MFVTFKRTRFARIDWPEEMPSLEFEEEMAESLKTLPRQCRWSQDKASKVVTCLKIIKTKLKEI